MLSYQKIVFDSIAGILSESYGAPNGSKKLLREFEITFWSSGYLFGVRYTCLEFDTLVWSSGYLSGVRYTCLEFDILFRV